MLPLAQIMEHYNIFYHSYVNNTQLYKTVLPHDYSPLNMLDRCIKQINKWMCQNFLKLNTDKTQIIVFGPKEKGLKGCLTYTGQLNISFF